ncbi:hypothetical protein AG0111_0g945 [Alternaria gaisen]|uniref:Uncharacterized protein n=1 Tax=Alternaria gaisen TaxID=167740 RepID=A0ACB6FZB9_9PLEO|nr:hypothetical protein AG0111_0g945 [Alternaria gaisen]
MSDADPSTLYHKQYQEARKLFDSDIVNCIAAAKKNLLDPTLPPFYIIKNCILVAGAVDEWNIADDWLRWAEQAFKKSHDLATRQQDNNSLEALAGLREELDELKEFKMEDFTGMTKEERDMIDAEMEELEALAEAENMTEVAAEYLEDSEAVAEAENTMEVAAEHLCIPIRPAGEPTHDTSDPAVGSKSRRQKSTRSKGGAYHAQQFSRSRSNAKLRPSVLNYDWARKEGDEKP